MPHAVMPDMPVYRWCHQLGLDLAVPAALKCVFVRVRDSVDAPKYLDSDIVEVFTL